MILTTFSITLKDLRVQLFHKFVVNGFDIFYLTMPYKTWGLVELNLLGVGEGYLRGLIGLFVIKSGRFTEVIDLFAALLVGFVIQIP